jgi:hypothetical protein
MANAAHESRQRGEDGGKTIRKPRLGQTKNVVEKAGATGNSDWLGSSSVSRRLVKCLPTALGNHVQFRMPKPLDELRAH